MARHFLTGAELTPSDLRALLDRAAELKADPRGSRALDGRVVALVFQKPSTRTRVSFEAGIVELGGHPMILRNDEMRSSRSSPRTRRSRSSTCSPTATTRARRWPTC